MGGVYSFIMHVRSRLTMDPRIPTMPVRSMLGFRSANRREMFGESY